MTKIDQELNRILNHVSDVSQPVNPETGAIQGRAATFIKPRAHNLVQTLPHEIKEIAVVSLVGVIATPLCVLKNLVVRPIAWISKSEKAKETLEKMPKLSDLVLVAARIVQLALGALSTVLFGVFLSPNLNFKAHQALNLANDKRAEEGKKAEVEDKLRQETAKKQAEDAAMAKQDAQTNALMMSTLHAMSEPKPATSTVSAAPTSTAVQQPAQSGATVAKSTTDDAAAKAKKDAEDAAAKQKAADDAAAKAKADEDAAAAAAAKAKADEDAFKASVKPIPTVVVTDAAGLAATGSVIVPVPSTATDSGSVAPATDASVKADATVEATDELDEEAEVEDVEDEEETETDETTETQTDPISQPIAAKESSSIKDKATNVFHTTMHYGQKIVWHWPKALGKAAVIDAPTWAGTKVSNGAGWVGTKVSNGAGTVYNITSDLFSRGLNKKKEETTQATPAIV